jgi:ACS family hexuronate transporter-like MFS transporter
LICVLLLFATTVNYVDRQILALLKPTLDLELGWTNQQFGLVNSAFQAAYGVGLLGFGWFIDRVGTRTGYAVSALLWSLAALSHALVGSVVGFRWARIGLGLSEAGNWPAAVKAVSEWFPQKERALATSIFNAGTMLGAIVAPATVPFIAHSFGWRATFVFGGLAGFVWLGFWFYFYQTPEKHAWVGAVERDYIQDGVKGPGEGSNEVSWLELLRYRQTWSFAIGKFMTDPVWWFYLIWLPDFFHKTKGLDLKGLGPPIVTLYAMATVLSIAGARMSDWLIQRGWTTTRSRKVCMLVFVLCELPILLQVKHCGLWGAVMWIGLAAGVHQAWSANLFTSVSDMFPKQMVASVIGLGGTVGCISGIMFPIFAGRLLDRFSQGGNVNTGYGVLFAICGSAYLVAFTFNHLFAPRFERIR